MSMRMDSSLLNQIDNALEFEPTLKDSTGKYMASPASYETFYTLALAAISRATGDDSIYVEQARYALNQRKSSARVQYGVITEILTGILQSVRSAISDGYLDSVSDVIHGTVFADFLEMAQHLLDHGYKDAAAVIAGSSLESHLRHLCTKHGLDPENENGRRKKADRINADLAKANVYDKSQQKHITAWMATRNDAAHGDYDNYSDVVVNNMISGIRHFVVAG